MDGPTTSRKLRTMLDQYQQFQPWIICCSAYDQDSFIEEAYAAGMDKFFTKPVSAVALIDEVRAALLLWAA